MNKLILKNPLFFVFCIPASIDFFVTVLGQDINYWRSFSQPNEAAPIGFVLLAVSPYFFLFMSLLWIVFLYIVVKKLKEPYNIWLSFLLLVAHSWGSSSWIAPISRRIGFFQDYSQSDSAILWTITIVYFSLITRIASYSISKYIKLK